jgi:hypothetical protein
MTKAHSTIGASSMYRWSACPGSVRLSEGMPNKTSIYAAEGTAAHALAESMLSGKPITTQFIIVEGHRIEVTDEMRDFCKVYVDTCLEGGKTDMRHVEHRFDLSAIYPGLFGTADYVRYNHAHRLLTVVDFKYGAGIPVEVKDNPQLYYYALGALLTLKYPALEVEMVIVQPRCHHADGPVRRHRISVIDMLDFKVDLVEFATATQNDNAPLHSGDHCRFCPAAPKCPELTAKANHAAADAFAPPKDSSAPYDANKLAEALRLADVVEGWAKSVREFAYAEAEAGRTVPGFKLVAKQARRSWKDVAEAEVALRAAGLGETQMYAEPVLRSPAQIETVLKDLGKKPAVRQAIVEPLTEKKSSGNVLAPDSDGRQAVVKQSAADAFSKS